MMRLSNFNFVFLFYLIAGLCCCLEAQDNQSWIGRLVKWKMEKVSPDKVSLLLVMEEYIQEGKCGNFQEDKIVFLDRTPDLKKWTITLDRIAAGKYATMVYEPADIPLIQKVVTFQQQGSFSDPTQQQTKAGTPIMTTKIVITGSKPIFINSKELDKKNTSLVTMKLEASDKLPTPTLPAKEDNKIEICVADFEKQRAVGHFFNRISETQHSPKHQQYLAELKKIPDGTFMTLIYPVKYHDIQLLRTQVDLIRSELGQVGVIESSAKLIVRDRAQYLREILEMLLHLDKPVPQATIDVRIVERNLEEGSDIFSTLSYLHKNGNETYSGTLGNSKPTLFPGSNLGGGYTRLTDTLLQNFQVQINSEIRQGKARLRATTRILCKNRETAQFNSGNSIPYYRMDQYTRNTDDYTYRSNEKNRSATDTESTDTAGAKSNSSSANTYKRDWNYDQRELLTGHTWNVVFIQTGVNLSIKPYIKNSNLVELYLKPSYSEITGLATSNDIPILSNRSLDTVVTLKNGDTILVGGLLYEKELKLNKGIPLLMDIPLIGGLFSTEITKKQQTEVIFILTVYIQEP